jgi:hypothetical protein
VHASGIVARRPDRLALCCERRDTSGCGSV